MGSASQGKVLELDSKILHPYCKGWRRASGAAMDNTLNQYRTFYRALLRFEAEFPYKLVPSCPVALWNMYKIHLILQPDDEDFANNSVQRVVQKVRLVLDVTQRVLEGINRFVRPSETWWVRAKQRSLGTFAHMVQVSLVSLHCDQQENCGSDAGMGGLNLVDIETNRIIDTSLYQELEQMLNVFS
ncbi:hypothetical protein RRG08_016980 [Elysia crispata]|uniref:Uncharacterized protein n=1 Tax=Elysia crispata TaxID=231223 RepID=A0AAE0XYP3_9GAST|nr:hypothetical protein RRG08_016980 [Elysia crispata]